MEISEMIVTRILKDKLVTLTQLETKAVERNVSMQDLYFALDKVHNDKRIIKSARSSGEIIYKPAPPPKPKVTLRYTGYYPTEEIKESPFLVCSCPLFHIHWEMKYGHFPDCDAHHPDYPVQNPWDYMAGVMIDYEQYAKVCEQEKAKRSKIIRRQKIYKGY